MLPARELLGDMLVLLDQADAAIDAYEASLRISPNRYHSLYGAGQAAALNDDMPKARAYYTKLVTLAALGDRSSLQIARKFLADH